ncbi:MAG: hypothetical protein KUG79_03605 [Pseudomonadales bacterium]|nr:hypothetical protein [Pseudomonadales bacterium]
MWVGLALLCLKAVFLRWVWVRQGVEHGPNQVRNPAALLYFFVRRESGPVEQRYYVGLCVYFDTEVRRDDYSPGVPDEHTLDDNIDGHDHNVNK